MQLERDGSLLFSVFSSFPSLLLIGILTLAQVLIWSFYRRGRGAQPLHWWAEALELAIGAVGLSALAGFLIFSFVDMSFETRDQFLFYKFLPARLFLRVILLIFCALIAAMKWKNSPERSNPWPSLLLSKVGLACLAIGLLFLHFYVHINFVNVTFIALLLVLWLHLGAHWPEYRSVYSYAVFAVFGPTLLVLGSDLTFAPGEEKPRLLELVAVVAAMAGCWAFHAFAKRIRPQLFDWFLWLPYVLFQSLWLFFLLLGLVWKRSTF